MSTAKCLELASYYQLDLQTAKLLEAEVVAKVRASSKPKPEIVIGRGRRPVDPPPLSPLTMDADEDVSTFHARSRAHQDETEARKSLYDNATWEYVEALEWAYTFQKRYELELEYRFGTASHESYRMARTDESSSQKLAPGDPSTAASKNTENGMAVDANGVQFFRRQPACYTCVASGNQCLTAVGRELEGCWFCVRGNMNCDRPNPYASMCDSLRRMEPWLEKLSGEVTGRRAIDSEAGGIQTRLVQELVEKLEAQGGK